MAEEDFEDIFESSKKKDKEVDDLLRLDKELPALSEVNETIVQEEEYDEE